MNEVSAVTNKVHERVVKQGIVPKKIVGIEFGVPTEEAMRRMSHLQIFNRELYMSSNTTTTDDLQTHAPTPSPHQQQQPSSSSSNNDPTKPYPHGVLDGRMGLSSKKGTCETCGLSLQDCIGHFGYVKLELPVFHVGYMKNIVEVLQRICKSCGRILLLDNDCQSYLRRFRLPHLETLQKKALYKQIGEKCKKVTQCPHCQSIQGTIRKVQALKIVHEKYKSKNKDAAQAVDEFMSEFDQAISYNKDLKPYLNRAQEDLSPLKVLKILKRVSDVDVELLDMDPQVTRPEQLILTHMLVPPLCIRPSVASDNGTNEDDLTSCMSRIIHTNSMIRQSIKKGEPVESLMELWDYLSNECAVFINSEQPGLGNNIGKPVKPIRSLCQRLKGKYGRFRGNLSGKRVDFSGRTVISPDPNLELWQVAVPELVAKVLTFPECVNKYNKKKLQKLILNGPDVHPGANFVEFKHDGTKKFLKFAKRDEIAANLQIGDIVERHVMDNDIALFNRQPSLHRLSIMSHRVKVLPYRTFRFNVCDCAPFNADFDGDEMNLHIPQTQEARAEAINLMGVLWNLCTPKNGCPVIACNQDFLTAGYKMSRRDMFFDRSQFCMLMSYMGIEESIKIDLPPPTIWKPIELWTGKQLFSLLIKPNRQTHVHVNLETKAKNYEKDLFMDPNDGYVYFYNSQLLCGNLDKKTLGDGSKSSLFYMLMRNYGPEYAAKCMARVARVTSRWLMNYGFSIGIDDVTPSERLTEKKMVLLDDGYNFCENKIAEWRTGKLEAQPGCTTEQTLEAVLNKELSEIRNKAGNMCLGELHPLNAPLTMAVCGSKGSTINISQMIACVGQQTVGGSRIQNGFMNRTLPHFPLGSRSASAKGFVANSFYTGLTPTEFFFHTMAGREGLVDTAVKTAETGYMQRRLMKALEDLAVQYDYTVRNSSGGLIQFKYGDDKLDPIHMEDDAGRPLSLQYALDHVKHIVNMEKEEKMLASNNKNNETDLEYYMKYNIGLEPDEIMKRVKDFLLEKKSQRLFSKQFAKEYTGFFRDCADKLRKLKTELSEKNDTVWNDVIEKVEDIKITEAQLTAFFDWTYKKYLKAVTEPGQTVGAIAGQSIGEPGTQMTLKTFHFAGVASMNVTLGVPRIVEIINATRNISTPIITAELDIAKNLTAQEEKLLSLMIKNSNNNKGGSQINKIQFRNSQGEKAARIVKGRIEKATLGEVCEYIKEVYDMGICYIDIKLDRHIIGALQLNINNATVVNSIQYAPKLGIKDKFIRITDDCIRVYPLKSEREHMYHSMQYLKSVLPGVIVSGIPSIGRAVINKKKTKEDGRVKLNLLVEGSDLLSVMGTQGVKGRKTTTNNILELEEILGIEAARGTIINEIYFIMSSYGMNVDVRHMKLLADVMSFKGEILGITRYGIGKMRDSVLMLASFERTTDHLFDAAVHSRRDAVEGVSECIIMGMPIGNGTGIFKLLQKVNVQPKEQPKPIFAL